VRWVDLAGYIASSLVFLTFYMRGMIPLRLIALCSNVAFLVYACTLHLLPIVILHGALIPVNICRLMAARRSDSVKLPISTLGVVPRKWRA
jgi:CRP/FNR family cyclic AMP-dependent transcriptional regulator